MATKSAPKRNLAGEAKSTPQIKQTEVAPQFKTHAEPAKDDSSHEQVSAQATAEIYGPGVSPPDDSQLMKLSEWGKIRDGFIADPRDLRSRVPAGWPLTGWKTPSAPINNSIEALTAWIDFAINYLKSIDGGLSHI